MRILHYVFGFIVIPENAEAYAIVLIVFAAIALCRKRRSSPPCRPHGPGCGHLP